MTRSSWPTPLSAGSSTYAPSASAARGSPLEIEVDGDRVFGQVLDVEVPVHEVVVESVAAGSQTCPVDASGVFSVVVPSGSVRFGVRVDGVLRRTPWVELVA